MPPNPVPQYPPLSSPAINQSSLIVRQRFVISQPLSGPQSSELQMQRLISPAQANTSSPALWWTSPAPLSSASAIQRLTSRTSKSSSKLEQTTSVMCCVFWAWWNRIPCRRLLCSWWYVFEVCFWWVADPVSLFLPPLLNSSKNQETNALQVVYDQGNQNIHLAQAANCGTNLVPIGKGVNAVPSSAGDCAAATLSSPRP